MSIFFQILEMCCWRSKISVKYFGARDNNYYLTHIFSSYFPTQNDTRVDHIEQQNVRQFSVSKGAYFHQKNL